jgi:hypothetical protein
VNLTNISAGSPVSSLPVDPTNQTSSDLYYTYNTNGNQYQVGAFMESTKYAKSAFNDGGSDPTLLESGSGAASLADVGRGLIGYWALNEGNGSTTVDWSGSGNNGIWQGTATGTSGYYSPGKVWQWGGAFDGNTDSINVPTSTILNATSALTISAWIEYTASLPSSGVFPRVLNRTNGSNGYEIILHSTSPCYSGGPINDLYFQVVSGGVSKSACAAANVVPGTMYYITATYNGSTGIFYINGVAQANTFAGANVIGSVSQALTIGSDQSIANTYWTGLIDDVRVYNRALSAAEIQEIYNEEK